MADAIVRANYRMFVSRRRLLEWETADAAERRLQTNPWSSFREMAGAPIVSVAVMIGLTHAAYAAVVQLLQLSLRRLIVDARHPAEAPA